MEVVWKNKKDHGVSPINVQPFLQDGVLYGYDDSGKLYAVELPERQALVGGRRADRRRPEGLRDRVHGEERRPLLLLRRDRPPRDRQADAQGLRGDRAAPRSSTRPDAAFGRKVVWCAPAYADKKAFIRNDKEIICVDLAK